MSYKRVSYLTGKVSIVDSKYRPIPPNTLQYGKSIVNMLLVF